MTTLNLQKLKTEMVVFLRNADILTTTQRGVTTISDKFSATAGQTVFTLSNAVTRNIRAITVEGASKSAYVDYNPDYKAVSSTVTFLTGLSAADQVVVGYDYSSGTIEKIWSDYPELIYVPNDAPRIGFGFPGFRTRPLGIGNTNWISDAFCSIKVYDKNEKTIDGYISTIREKLKAAQRSFFHFQIVTPTNIGPAIVHDVSSGTKLAGKVFEKAIDLIMRFNYES